MNRTTKIRPGDNQQDTNGEARGRDKAALSELLDRMPPADVQSEQCVLGSLLLDPRRVDEVALILRAEDFYSSAHQVLYARLLAMHEGGKPIDTRLLVVAIEKAGELESVGGFSYLAELAGIVPLAAHAEHYAAIVRDKARLRLVRDVGLALVQESYKARSEPIELLQDCEAKVFAMLGEQVGDHVRPISDVLQEAMAAMDANTLGVGIDSGFQELDSMIGGLRECELTVLAGRPGMGKTSLGLNIAEHVSRSTPVYFASLEMSRLELAGRLLCAKARVNGYKYRNAMLAPADRHVLVEASSQLSQQKLLIDDTPQRSGIELCAQARRLKRKGGLGLVVVDYLQLVAADGQVERREEQVAQVTRRLKTLARELDVPVLCLAQLNRQAEATPTTRPMLSHLRESGAIEQAADVVLFIHRADMHRTEGFDNQAELIVAKNRNGPTGTVKLAWSREHTRFDNLAHRHGGEF